MLEQIKTKSPNTAPHYHFRAQEKLLYILLDLQSQGIYL